MRIAIARGRVLKEALKLFSGVGIELIDSPQDNRKLILATTYDGLEVIVVRSSDVVTYVEYGTANFGIVGRDVLMEHTGDNLYELCDLNISRCRMVVAARPDYQLDDSRRIKVATKYPLSTRRHFAKQARQTEIVKLNGSVELAPLIGISDMIVDLVDTGRTLRENNLVEIEEITSISARLIANKALLKVKNTQMRAVIDRIIGKVSK